MADEQSKLHIDSDWKKQAQEEKERLAREAEQKAQRSAPAGAEPVGPDDLPPASFGEIMATIGTQVLMFLGDIPSPSSDQPMVSLPLAKHYIDLLSILDEKTRGNLTDDEKRQLDSLLYETRMRYVQLASGDVGPVGPPPEEKGKS